VDGFNQTLDKAKAFVDLRKKADGGDKEDGGKLRYELVEALGALRDRDSVDLLIEVLSQTEKQPAAVYRAAASALGSIADPKAIDALVLAPFRVKDAMSTTNLGNRAKLALVAIGDPAVDTLGRALRGEHADAPVSRREHGSVRLGCDDADHRHRELPLQVWQRGGRRGVTGREDQLHALPLEVARDLEREAPDLVQRARPVREPRAVAEVDEVLVRERDEALVQDGQAAHPRIEHAYRARVHAPGL